jgi:hypothetical protein
LTSSGSRVGALDGLANFEQSVDDSQDTHRCRLIGARKASVWIAAFAALAAMVSAGNPNIH